MRTAPSFQETKPVSQVWQPELTRLPRLTWGRRLLRFFFRSLFRLVFIICTRPKVRGLENFPEKGPGLVVTNHLGDADTVFLLAYLPVTPEPLAKVELYHFPKVGKLMHAFGVIWVHRGRPDRRAVRVALEALQDGRLVGLAPEGRESLTGALEPGTDGAAFLAYKAGVPVVPVTVTGTENNRLYGNLKRWRRTPVTLTVGKPFNLPQAVLKQDVEGSKEIDEEHVDHQRMLQEGTRLIMETLARQLPREYRGVYSYVEVEDE